MNNILDKIQLLGIIPVVSIEDKKNARPLAKALIDGEIPCAEITLRTSAGLESISEIASMSEDMIIGAGSVNTLDNCKDALSAGAKFIVSPGLNHKVVEYCVSREIPVFPGCVTSSEILTAMSFGLDTVKFFPSEASGGLTTMKALSGPFPNIKFIPTGGINGFNLGEYLSAPFVCAVGGSWLCEKSDVRSGNFEKITNLCKDAKQAMLGFEFAHMGINTTCEAESLAICAKMADAFGLPIKNGNSSNFAGPAIEVTNYIFPGTHGHIAIRTNSISRAIAALEGNGYKIDMETAKYKGNRIVAVYLAKELGGFAIHLLQK